MKVMTTTLTLLMLSAFALSPTLAFAMSKKEAKLECKKEHPGIKGKKLAKCIKTKVV